jgi:solute carrier family 35 protein F1/2
MLQIILREGDAAIFNMSLLTSDFFGVLAGFYLFHESLSLLYFIGFLFIIAGLVVYSQAPTPTACAIEDLNADNATIRLLPDKSSPHLTSVCSDMQS